MILVPGHIAGRGHDWGDGGPQVLARVGLEGALGGDSVEDRVDKKGKHRPEPGVGDAQGYDKGSAKSKVGLGLCMNDVSCRAL